MDLVCAFGEQRRSTSPYAPSWLIIDRMQGTAIYSEEKTVNVVELLVPEVKSELAQQVKREIILRGLPAFF